MSELLEKILSKNNMNAAYRKVCANGGAGGVDGVTVEKLGEYIVENWESIREQIRRREYRPQPVRRVEIPKPNGGVRKLGIPTVMDRVIQQGIVQVISPMCEPLFSQWSYGFRPNRNCEMAIRQLLLYLNDGYEWIVDIDLEKFFDNVPQDNDVFEKGAAVYPIERMNMSTGMPFDDGEHILYINGQYSGDDDLGRLMHDFRCSDPDDMLNEDLASRTRYFKEDPEGVRYMCKAMEDMRNETKDNTIIENIRSLMDTVKWTAQQAMDALKIPVDEQSKYLSKL